MKHKLLALLTALALCLALVGCGSTPDNVGQIENVEISSGMYLLVQYNAYQEAAALASAEQDPTDTAAFLKQTITPDEESGEVKLSDFVAARTAENLRLFAAIETRFAALGGELAPQDIATADSYAQQLMDNGDGVYQANGIGLETLKTYERSLMKETRLLDLVYGPEGEAPVSDDELTDYLNHEMLYGLYVVMPLYNPDTFAFATDEMRAQMLSLSQQAAAVCNSTAASSAAESAALFSGTLADYLPVIYGVLSADYSASDLSADMQSGLITSAQLGSYFLPEAADALRASDFNKVTAVQYSDFSLMLFLRLDPLEMSTLDALRTAILADLKTDALVSDLQTMAASLSDGINSGAAAKLPAAKIVNK